MYAGWRPEYSAQRRLLSGPAASDSGTSSLKPAAAALSRNVCTAPIALSVGVSGRQQRTSGRPLTTVTSAASRRAATKPPTPAHQAVAATRDDAQQKQMAVPTSLSFSSSVFLALCRLCSLLPATFKPQAIGDWHNLLQRYPYISAYSLQRSTLIRHRHMQLSFTDQSAPVCLIARDLSPIIRE